MTETPAPQSPQTGQEKIRHQFPRYVLVGGGSALTDLSLYALLSKIMGVHPLWANLVSRPAGGLFSFFVNRRWTFGAWGTGRGHVHFARFWAVWVFSFAISESLIWLFHEGFHLGPVTTKVCAEGLTGIFTFLCHRLWTFR